MTARERMALRAAVVLLLAALEAGVPARAQDTGAPPPVAPLRGGPARTPQEIRACREAELARAEGRPSPKVIPPDQPVRLRSTPALLAEGACEEAARRWNFAARGTGDCGCFVNAYLYQPRVIQDLTTGLMWSAAASKRIPYQAALAGLAKLNARAWEGHSDWRLPTTEEALSILEAYLFGQRTHLNPEFFEGGLQWWTSDAAPAGQGRWVVDATLAQCSTLAPKYEALSRAVRTMSADELAAGRAALAKER